MGYLADRTFASRKPHVLTACLGLQSVNWAFLSFLSAGAGGIGLGISFFVMGMMSAGTLSVFWAIVREEAPPERMGTAMGFLNPAPFLAIALFQPLTGFVMDRVGRVAGVFPPEAYRNAFAVCFASMVAAALISLLSWKKMGWVKE